MKGDSWVKIGSTEQINNNLNPDFKTCITIDYKFEKLQKIKFQMMDSDLNGTYDFIGELETTVGALMGAKNQVFMDRLQSQDGEVKRIGVLIVRVEAVTESNQAAKFKFKWSHVNNLIPGCFGMCKVKNKYRFTIERQAVGVKMTKNQFIKVKQSLLYEEDEVTTPKQELHWLTDICNNNKTAPIKFAIVSESGKELNSVVTSIEEMLTRETFYGKAGAQLSFT